MGLLLDVERAPKRTAGGSMFDARRAHRRKDHVKKLFKVQRSEMG
jgi:hypothetical protein